MINKKINMIDTGDRLMTEKNYEFIEELMRIHAKDAGVIIDENTLSKVARARFMMNVDMKHCPCARDEEGRGCVGSVCMNEMKNGTPDKNGRKYCHCHCFYLED